MTSRSEYLKMSEAQQKEYWKQNQGDLPTVADTLIVCLLTELRRSGLLGESESMRVMKNFCDACEDTPLYCTEAYYQISIFLMELIDNPIVNAHLELHRRNMKEKLEDSKRRAEQKE